MIIMAIKFGDHFFITFGHGGKALKNNGHTYLYTSRAKAEHKQIGADVVEYAPFHTGSWERIGADYVECKHCGTLFSKTDDVNAGSNKWRYCPWCGSNNIEVTHQ
jgi:hypothetical protein